MFTPKFDIDRPSKLLIALGFSLCLCSLYLPYNMERQKQKLIETIEAQTNEFKVETKLLNTERTSLSNQHKLLFDKFRLLLIYGNQIKTLLPESEFMILIKPLTEKWESSMDVFELQVKSVEQQVIRLEHKKDHILSLKRNLVYFEKLFLPIYIVIFIIFLFGIKVTTVGFKSWNSTKDSF